MFIFPNLVHPNRPIQFKPLYYIGCALFHHKKVELHFFPYFWDFTENPFTRKTHVYTQILENQGLPLAHFESHIVCTWKLRYIINYLSLYVYSLVKKIPLILWHLLFFHTPSFSFYAIFDNILLSFFSSSFCCCCYFYVYIGCLHLRFSFMLESWLG